MQPKEFRSNLVLLLFDYFNLIRLFEVLLWNLVHPEVVKRVFRVGHHPRVQEIVNEGLDKPLIFIICDSATLINYCCQNSDNVEL